MPDPLILVPALAVILPGLLAFGLCRRLRSVWPGVVLALLALGSGVILVAQASGASWNDATALNRMFVVFGVSLPAMISVAVGASLAHRMRQR